MIPIPILMTDIYRFLPIHISVCFDVKVEDSSDLFDFLLPESRQKVLGRKLAAFQSLNGLSSS